MKKTKLSSLCKMLEPSYSLPLQNEKEGLFQIINLFRQTISPWVNWAAIILLYMSNIELKLVLTAVGNVAKSCSYMGTASEIGICCGKNTYLSKKGGKRNSENRSQIWNKKASNIESGKRRKRLHITNASVARSSAASTLYLSVIVLRASS